MIALSLVASLMLAASKPSNCPMTPPPLAVDTFKSSKEVKSFVVDSPKSANLLLKDGSLVRIKSMGCVDSGAVAQVLVPNPPSDNDIATWRKLFSRLAKTAFGSYGDGIAQWVPDAKFERTDRYILNASGGEDPQFEITVENTAYSMGYVVTLSFNYN